MSLTSQLLHQIADPTLTYNEQARLRCRLSKELEETGNYVAASQALGEIWSHIGERPTLDDVDEATTAEVILRVGVLTGWIGSAGQVNGSQELAKNLISESITYFESLQDEGKIAEAQIELATCYWREGAFDEARVVLQEALRRLPDKDSEIRLVALLRSAIIEMGANRFNDALRIDTEAASLFEKSHNHALKGKFHNGFGKVLRNLGEMERREDYIDRALIEYAAASYHFEQAGHARYHGCVENNLGFLFSTLGKYREAHEHLDRAQALFTSLKDSVHLAQVDETRARVLLAEGRADAAEKLVRAAVQTLEHGGEQSLLAEALTTHGRALARLSRHQLARLTLQHAVEVAQAAGDTEGAGQASLAVIEELGEQLTPHDLGVTFDRAAELLSGTRHPGSKDRLANSARRVLFLLGVLPMPETWTNFSFKQAVRRYEACLVERALADAGGTTARAAQLLGIKRQSLDSMLHTRHQQLLPLRTPGEARKSSLMFRDAGGAQETRPVTILYVEDDHLIAGMVKEMLEDEGWAVETCDDGADALSKIESADDYDLMIFDQQLPHVTGLELIRRARSLAHRQQTPIIMLSSRDVERDARRAGANLYLRKPDDALALPERAARLLARRLKQN